MATITGTKPFGTATETIDDNYKISADRGYTVCVALEAGETIDHALAVIQSVGTALSGFPNLWLARRVPRQISRRYVEVDLEFSAKPADVPDLGTDPTTWPAKWLGSDSELKQRVMYKDIFGADVLLTNGEMYATPVYEMVNVLSDRWLRYYYPILPGSSPPGALTLQDYILFWNNAINDAPYRGKPKYTWMVTVSAAPVVVGEYQLAELTFTLKYNKLRWIEERLQHGSYYLDAADGNKKKPFRDDLGNPITGNLNSTGNANGSTRFYKEIRGSYEERDFDELGF